MILRYGSYSHPDNEVIISISQRPTFNEIGLRSGYVASWSIQGMLQGSSVSDLSTKIIALESAYGADGLDLVLYDSDGSTVRHAMRNTGSRTGVKILDLSYPTGDGAEYVTFRTYTIQAEAEYNQDLGVYSTSETVRPPCRATREAADALHVPAAGPEYRGQHMAHGPRPGVPVGGTSRATTHHVQHAEQDRALRKPDVRRLLGLRV
jgi:hypothetical protein